MKFEVNTVMDRKSMTAMAKAARKTMRRRRNLVIRVFGGIASVMAALMGVIRCGSGDMHGWIDIALAAGLTAIILLEDATNGRIAMRQVHPDDAEVSTLFREDGYTNATSSAEGHWTYDKIQIICETKDYFVLLMNKQHGQVYAKKGFVQGSPEEFSSFISEKTGKPVQYIK